MKSRKENYVLVKKNAISTFHFLLYFQSGEQELNFVQPFGKAFLSLQQQDSANGYPHTLPRQNPTISFAFL